MNKKGGLGRGLSSMIDPTLSSLNENIVCEIDINKVEPNKDQPRKNFDEARMEALKVSIAEMGVILPIIVSKAEAGIEDKYSLNFLFNSFLIRRSRKTEPHD